MTINIAIAVSEGLVMAADSLSQMAEKDGAPVAVHNSVEKITELRGRPIALMIHGLGEIRKRTIISLIREFEFENDVLSDKLRKWSLVEIASNLSLFVKKVYEEAFPAPLEGEGASESRPYLGIILAGYNGGSFFPEIYEIKFPVGNWDLLFSEASSEREFIDYWGQRSALDRLLYGYDRLTVDEAEKFQPP